MSREIFASARGWFRKFSRPGVVYVVERGEWSIRQDGLAYQRAMSRLQPQLPFRVVDSPGGYTGQTVHFGSRWSFMTNYRNISPANRLVVTLFHGQPRDPDFAPSYSELERALPRLAKLVVSCSIMERCLIDWGAPPDKVNRVPLGVDTGLFCPGTEADRQLARSRAKVPAGAFCVCSFQKDGQGWEKGENPKLIKGPDIFLEVLQKLRLDRPIFVLLSGPARGYVRRGLEKLGLPYTHCYAESLEEMVGLYHAADVCLMTSREEGGPKALLESLAAGVPFVGTQVGMVPDLIRDGENGLTSAVEDIESLVRQVQLLAADDPLARRLQKAGRQTALAFDWAESADQLYTKVYRPLLTPQKG